MPISIYSRAHDLHGMALHERRFHNPDKQVHLAFLDASTSLRDRS